MAASPREIPRTLKDRRHRAALVIAGATATDAKTLRWSSQGDYLTADPMAQNELLTNSINGQVYETLVGRGKKLEILPALAKSWKQTSPTTWVFNLRKGVKFHDGTPIHGRRRGVLDQALQGKTSNFRVYGNAVGDAEEDRRLHGGVHHAGAQPRDAGDARQQPVHHEQGLVREEQGRKAQDFTNKEETFTVPQRHGHGALTSWSRATRT